jgi:hypothetical protein
MKQIVRDHHGLIETGKAPGMRGARAARIDLEDIWFPIAEA